MANAPVIVIENSSSNFLEYRLRGRPSVISFEELNLGHSSLRKIAPYALKIRQTAVIPTQQFFNYVAIVATIDETNLACIIFDLVNADQVVAYAGHFVTHHTFIFDPVTREPVVSDFSLLDVNQHHIHLSLFGTANPNLVMFPDYFLHRVSEPYQELVTKSQDMLMSTLQQQQQNNIAAISSESNQVIYLLREPLTTSFYHETALPISNKSVERITQKIQPMGSVKRFYGELGSFHPQTHCQPKANEDATNFNAVDDVDGRTTYYSAYEEPGLMSFYFTSFLLGSLQGRHVVGVIVADSFFIMATSRVYKRNSPLIPISSESLEGSEVMKKIHLPCSLPLHQVVTMLELRQILRHPFMFPDEMEAITKSFGFDEGDEKPFILNRTFVHQLGPKTMIERIRRSWLQEMLDIHYTQSFQNSLCEFGESPVDSENPSLFCLNIARLWIKELLRVIHLDKQPKDDCKLSNFFRMTIVEFVQCYLSLFGLSPESCFTCQHVGVDGIPTSVCNISVPAKDIGKHVQVHHTSQLWSQDHFKPFSLALASKFISLTNQTDVTPLEKCKLTVADYRGISYMEVLRKIDGMTSSSPPPTPPPLPSPAEPDSAKRSKKHKKRRRRSVQEKIFYKVMREQRKENSMAALESQVSADSPAPVSPRLTRSIARFIFRDV